MGANNDSDLIGPFGYFRFGWKCAGTFVGLLAFVSVFKDWLEPCERAMALAKKHPLSLVGVFVLVVVGVLVYDYIMIEQQRSIESKRSSPRQRRKKSPADRAAANAVHRKRRGTQRAD